MLDIRLLTSTGYHILAEDVSFHLHYRANAYYRHFVLDFIASAFSKKKQKFLFIESIGNSQNSAVHACAFRPL